MTRSVPLHLRLPNPPAHFTGRTEELAQLAAAIARAPVSVVWGLGGVGKTTLAVATIHNRFAGQLSGTLHIAVADGADPVEEVARALARVAGRRMDWREILGDPDAMTALAIDLAESAQPAWWMIVDDLHRADPERAERLIDGFARYGRASRLVVTTRIEPRLEVIAGQIIGVGAMPEADLEQLARRVGRGDVDAQRLARRAAGSPWRLLSQLDMGTTSHEDLGLPRQLIDFLAVLAPVEAWVPYVLLTDLLSGAPSLDTLVHQGLLMHSPAGFRVHDVVRGLIPLADRDQAAQRAAQLISRSDRPDLVLESVRLYLDAGKPEPAARLARTHLDSLLAAGLAPRLWALIASRTEEALASLRLRCAVELGSVEAAKSVRRPIHPSLDDELYWAHLQRFVSSMGVVAELATGVLERARAADDRRVAFEAGLLRARCRVQIATDEDAAAEIEALHPANADERARRDNVLAQVMMNAGRPDRAVELARACLVEADELSEATFEEVTAGVARVLYMAGLLDEAADAVREIERRFGRASLSSFHTRTALNTLILILQDRGDLRGVQEVLRWYAPLVGNSTILGVSVRIASAMQRLLGGDLDGLQSYLHESLEFARASGSVNSEAMLAAIACRLDTLQGRRHPDDPMSPPDPVLRTLCAIWSAQNRIRHDDVVDVDFSALEREAASHPELALVAQLVGAEQGIVVGRADAAAASTARIASELEQRDLMVAWTEASLLRAEALLVAGEPQRAARVARAVRERATQMPSPRWIAEAQLIEALCAASLDLVTLDELADSASPVAARRARSLTGEAPPIDFIDRRVIQAARTRTGDSIEIVSRKPGSRWGIDLERRAVWMPGRVVLLAQKPVLFRVLEELTRHGGRASKETLVKSVWNVNEYHPLQHDNRLQLAVLKIRREIEQDPKHPTRLCATEDGYELGGLVRCRQRSNRQSE